MYKITLQTLVVLALFSVAVNAQEVVRVKNSNVAGEFYSADPQMLSKHIQRLIDQASVQPINKHIDVIFMPHAGYVYSGAVAAHGFKAASLNQYKTVVIAGPSHFVETDEISVWAEGAYRTPLGLAYIDEVLAASLITVDGKIKFREDMFQKEYSVEVAVPFVQHVFKGAKIVPIVMGRADPALIVRLAKGLRRVVKQRDDVLLIVSTDLSHYFHENAAHELDQAALNAIADFDAQKIIRNNNKTLAVDGESPVLLGIYFAKEGGSDRAKILEYAHSGHVNGNVDEVVGYGSVVYYDKEDLQKPLLTHKQKRRLMKLARRTLKHYVKKGKVYSTRRYTRNMPQGLGARVCVYHKNQWHGCSERIVSDQLLPEIIRDLVISAVSEEMKDSAEYFDAIDTIDISISVLTKPQRVISVDDIVLGKHGVIMSHGETQGYFLPEVAGQNGWTKEKFLTMLAVQQAGLDADSWTDADVVLEVFTVDELSAQK